MAAKGLSRKYQALRRLRAGQVVDAFTGQKFSGEERFSALPADDLRWLENTLRIVEANSALRRSHDPTKADEPDYRASPVGHGFVVLNGERIQVPIFAADAELAGCKADAAERAAWIADAHDFRDTLTSSGEAASGGEAAKLWLEFELSRCDPADIKAIKGDRDIYLAGLRHIHWVLNASDCDAAVDIETLAESMPLLHAARVAAQLPKPATPEMPLARKKELLTDIETLVDNASKSFAGACADPKIAKKYPELQDKKIRTGARRKWIGRLFEEIDPAGYAKVIARAGNVKRAGTR